MNLGDTIKQERKKRGYSQFQFAGMCQISITYLSLIETNKKEPAVSLLKVICDNLNLPLPILFFLSLDTQDIPSEKVHIYNILKPFLENSISNLFLDDKEH